MSGEIEQLKEIMRLLVVRETEHARLRGFSDCCCMALSRSAEREYETGKCPHQLARGALEKTNVVTLPVIRVERYDDDC